MTYLMDIDGQQYESGPLVRVNGVDSGQCLVYNPRHHASIVVSVSDVALQRVPHVQVAREDAIRVAVRRVWGSATQAGEYR